MIENLFKFLTEAKVDLTEDSKKAITESFNLAVQESTKEHKSLLKEAATEIEKRNGLLKEAVVEITSLKTTKVKQVTEEVEKFKTSLVEKMSRYLDTKVDALVPKHLVEAQARVDILEPLVESLKSVFATSGIKLDERGLGILKEAKTEIVNTRETLNKTIAEKMKLEEATEKLLGSYLLKEKCEGLTPLQSKRVKTLMEGYTYEEVESKYKTIRDLVLVEGKTEEVKKVGKVVVEVKTVEKTESTEDLGQRLL